MPDANHPPPPDPRQRPAGDPAPRPAPETLRRRIAGALRAAMTPTGHGRAWRTSWNTCSSSAPSGFLPARRPDALRPGQGGQVNASTRERTTDFFSKCRSNALAGGLSACARCWPPPDLGIERQRREREVIHAEFIAWSRDPRPAQVRLAAIGVRKPIRCGPSTPATAIA